MRYVTGLYFDGMGEESRRLHEWLHFRLDDAIMLLSGLQQSPEDELIEEVRQEIEDAAMDIVVALTGKSCTLGNSLPYPGEEWSI
jgi:hypothetical protein